ncbi:MAG: isopentenyl-diphosphate Delta-isomerase [Bacteroidales bacterium]
MDNLIALVNKNDEVIGFDEKQHVHIKGLLHRAFSIFVFNTMGDMLIHRRAYEKYHSPGLWTNACCSHLTKGLVMEEAIHVRLNDEMGFDTKLSYIKKFHYNIEFDNGLTENEIDHIYIGTYNNNPKPNPEEVSDYAWVNPEMLKRDINENPENYTYWLKHIMANYFNDIENALQEIFEKQVNSTVQ